MSIIGVTTKQRVPRKALITVAEWFTMDGQTKVSNKEVLGVRTEDSSIELNLDTTESTDILGINYNDVNKTQPKQSFDPFNIIGGSALAEYLAQAVLENNIAAYTGTFNVYIIAAFLGATGAYKAVKHSGCSINPTSIGGDNFVNMPIEVGYSNNITKGTVNKLDSSFTFTPAAENSGDWVTPVIPDAAEEDFSVVTTGEEDFSSL